VLANVTGHYLSLTDKERLECLAFLSFHVSEIARGSYPEAGQETAVSLRRLEAYNEMLHVIAKQLLAELRGSTSGYPHDVFWQVLLEAAQRGGCEASLSWAVDKCLMVGERK
jgi:hypothetical protein